MKGGVRQSVKDRSEKMKNKIEGRKEERQKSVKQSEKEEWRGSIFVAHTKKTGKCNTK